MFILFILFILFVLFVLFVLSFLGIHIKCISFFTSPLSFFPPFSPINPLYPALFRGNFATIVRIFPYAAIQYAAFEQCFDTFEKLGIGLFVLSLLFFLFLLFLFFLFLLLLLFFLSLLFLEGKKRRFLAGACAGAISVSITYPLDLIRARSFSFPFFLSLFFPFFPFLSLSFPFSPFLSFCSSFLFSLQILLCSYSFSFSLGSLFSLIPKNIQVRKRKLKEHKTNKTSKNKNKNKNKNSILLSPPSLTCRCLACHPCSSKI